MKEYILKTRKDGTSITVRDVQLVLLEMLKDIDALCKKHNIRYWLTGGSALGAVRHKGFIPWDDDADIGMLREDYENSKGWFMNWAMPISHSALKPTESIMCWFRR